MSRLSHTRLPAVAMVLTVLAIAFPGAVVAAEPPPASLTGERIIGGPDTLNHTGTLTIDSADCDPNRDATISVDTYGFAAGPYVGEARESGTIEVGPATGQQAYPPFLPVSPVTGGELQFTIEPYSGGHISGTKAMGAAEATCYEDNSPLPPDGNVCVLRQYVSVQGEMTYQATITTPAGDRYTDSGEAYIRFGNSISECRTNGVVTFRVTVGSSGGFQQQFLLSDGLVPVPMGPATVTLDPPVAVNPVGTDHTVTITVTSASGEPVADSLVLITVSSRPERGAMCGTDANGQCTYTYTGPLLPGADVITACADANNSGTTDATDPCGEALKAWVLPASTPGQVTGGGYILDPTDGEKVAFGFNAQSTANGLKGNCTVVDAAPVRNVKVKCLSVTSLVQTGTHATFFGQAEVNGVLTDYRIDVDDIAEPGKGRDTFKIVTGTGYSAAGLLDGGNIQVHPAS